MVVKWIGAALIMLGCGGTGFYMAAMHNREIRTLQKLGKVLDFMSCELQYKLTPLPDLCRQAAGETSGSLSKLLLALSMELESQVSPNVAACMKAAMAKSPALPEKTQKCMDELGDCLGRFDLQGQIRALERARTSCRSMIEALEENKDVRLRTYRTLGVCAGAALVILLT